MVTVDSIFSSVLADIGLRGQPFRQIPEQLRTDDVETKERMRRELVRVFHSAEACIGKNLVLIWATELPYTHSDGKQLQSTIVYIEKLAGSVRGRWPERSLVNLAEDFPDRPLTDPGDLRHLARQNRNYSFYRRIVSEFGPLSLWQASVQELNAASDLNLTSARLWENRLLCKYLERHACFPLKNRQA